MMTMTSMRLMAMQMMLISEPRTRCPTGGPLPIRATGHHGRRPGLGAPPRCGYWARLTVSSDSERNGWLRTSAATPTNDARLRTLDHNA